jgi:hypothetical protein
MLCSQRHREACRRIRRGAPSNPEGTSSHVSTTAEIAAKLGLLVAECMVFLPSGRRSSLLTSLLNGAVSSSSDGDDMLCTVGGARLRTPCLIPGTSRNRSSSVTNGGSSLAHLAMMDMNIRVRCGLSGELVAYISDVADIQCFNEEFELDTSASRFASQGQRQDSSLAHWASFVVCVHCVGAKNVRYGAHLVKLPSWNAICQPFGGCELYHGCLSGRC